MKFPFLYLALALAAGILFSSLVALPLAILVSASALAIVEAWAFFFLFPRRLTAVFFSVLAATFFLGSSTYVSFQAAYEANSLFRFKASSYVDFYGTLDKSPARGKDVDYLFLKVEKVSLQNEEKPVKGRLRVTIPRSSESSLPPDLFAQDKIKVSAQLSSLARFNNFNLSSQMRYFKSQNLHSRATTKSPLLVEKKAPGTRYSPLRLISIVRQKLQKKIEEHFSPATSSLKPQGAVLEALLLGERGRMDNSLSRSLQASGLFHLFAISGAHVAIISFLLFSFFRLIRLPIRITYLLLILILLFYAFLVEGRPSVLRAVTMALAYLIGKLIWREVNLVNTLAVSAFFLLLANPFNLFSLGFQLTFAATLSIIIFAPPLIKHLPRLPLRIGDIFIISLAAQLGVLPFIAQAFNRVTFASLILNIPAIPLVGLIMGAGYIFFLVSFLAPSLTGISAKALESGIDLLISLSRLLDHSFLSFRVPTPPLTAVAGYFFFLFLLAMARKKALKILSSFLFIAFFLAIIVHPFPARSKLLKFTILDVGQGESILVEFPGNKKMLVDGGGLYGQTFDIGENVVSPVLWKKGIKKIDYLVLTHAHPDHLSGLKAVAVNFKIGEVWESLSPVADKDYEEFKKLLPRDALQKRVFQGDSFLIDRILVYALHPKRQEPVVPSIHNEHSLVLRLSFGQTSFLLTGDIGISSEAEILASGGSIGSQLLKSPHHGSNSSSSQAFLDAVRPRLVVISLGEKNIYGFPGPEVLKRYLERQAEVFRTDFDGAIEVSSDGEKIFVHTASGKD